MTSLDEIVAEIRNGVDLAQSDGPSSPDMLPISRIETISNGVIDFSRVKYARPTPKDRQKYQLQSGDILFSHINSPEHIGKTALFRDNKPLLHGINLLLLRVNREVCYPEYLNFYLKSSAVRARFRTRCKKAVNQASLNQGDILSLDVPIPTLPEQKRIAVILEKADRLRRTRRYARQLSDTFLQSVFLKMFGDLTKNQCGWEFDQLENCAEVVSGVAKGQKYGDKKTVEVPYLRVANVQDGYLDLSEIKTIKVPREDVEALRLESGDVLMTEGGDFDKLGRGAIWRGQVSNCIHQNHIFRVRLDRNRVLPVFFGAFLLNPFSKAYFLKCSKQTTNLASINMTQLRALPVPRPALPLQQKFAATVRSFERLRAQQREAERQAEHLFQTLLHRAFNGEM